MYIVSRDELGKLPNGTVFMEYEPDILNGQIHILTGSDGTGHWNGELSLTPFMDDFNHGIDRVNRLWSLAQWCTVDTATCDYDENQKFAVFNKTEIQQMINALIWAVSGCTGYFNEDIWIDENGLVFTDTDYYKMKKEYENADGIRVGGIDNTDKK